MLGFLDRWRDRRAGRGLVVRLTALVLAATALGAEAHTLGQGYLFVAVDESGISGKIEITLTDLDLAVGLDSDLDGKIGDDEIAAGADRVIAYLTDRVGVGADGRWFTLRFTGWEVASLPLGRYLELYYEAVDAEPASILSLRYEVLFDEDANHRGFLVITDNMFTGTVDRGEETSLVFTPDTSTQLFDLTEDSAWRSFRNFVWQGMWHIWIGIDHILFLLALILPAVLVRRAGSWETVNDAGPVFWQVIKIVTLFTIAHTITLTLAALEVFTLPSRLVESVIALSVIIAALNNIYPILYRHMGWIVFGFGLFHGFGFANVLSELVRSQSNLVLNLLGFNVGVEIGQIAVVAALVPLLFVLRNSAVYLRVLMPAGSVLIALLALGWFIERALDVDFLPI
jgi:hypothetical protein